MPPSDYPVRDTPSSGIYDRPFVERLFDEMAATYTVVNTLSSFGFCHRWRRQCAAQLSITSGDRVGDLMAGMGEMTRDLDRRIGDRGSIIGVDFSAEMCRHAAKKQDRWTAEVEVLRADALDSGIPDQSLDAIVSCFGLKTLSDVQVSRLATEVHRMLRPGGQFSFLEISVPRWPPLRIAFMIYLNRLIPLIGKLLLGNPDNYRMLGVYTSAFGDCAAVAGEFRLAGLETEMRQYFFRCATGVVGCRPA